MFRAEQQLEKGRLEGNDPQDPGARRLYQQAFGKWAEAFAQVEDLIEDEIFCEELLEVVGRYRRAILGGKPLPADFPLREVLKRWGGKAAQRALDRMARSGGSEPKTAGCER